MTSKFDARQFWNDGGPLLVLPQAAWELWKGTEVPTDRVVVARTRWDGTVAEASDYDRACDVEGESVEILDIDSTWAIVFGTGTAGSALFLSASCDQTFYVVGIVAADDATAEYVRGLLAADANVWRSLTSDVTIDAAGLVLVHAASQRADVDEMPATKSATETADAVIGNCIRFIPPVGKYAAAVCDIASDHESMHVVRFQLRAGAV